MACLLLKMACLLLKMACLLTNATVARILKELRAKLDEAAEGMMMPFNCKGSPGAVKAKENVTCPGGVWTPWT